MRSPRGSRTGRLGFMNVQWWSHVKRCAVLAAATVFSKALDVPIHRATPPGPIDGPAETMIAYGPSSITLVP